MSMTLSRSDDSFWCAKERGVGQDKTRCRAQCPACMEWAHVQPQPSLESWDGPRRVYLAGPMSNIPQFNVPAFMAARDELLQRGYDVVLPKDMDDPELLKALMSSADGARGTGTTNGMTWGDFLAADLKLIADGGIEGIVVLLGWTQSQGALLETFVARLLRLPIFTYHHTNPLTLVSLRLLQEAHDVGRYA